MLHMKGMLNSESLDSETATIETVRIMEALNFLLRQNQGYLTNKL